MILRPVSEPVITWHLSDMVFVQLVNLSTLELEPFKVHSLPPYLAISHVWSENLFPVSRGPRASCEGLKMIRYCLEQRPEYGTLRYFWTDTWCIDQTSDEDKNRQIPLMRDIYRLANVVIITVKHQFGFGQGDWDALIAGDGKLEQAFRYRRDGRQDVRFSREAVEYWTSETVAASLEAGIGMLKELAELPWMRRIWTAQEYILARDDVWVGADLRALRITPDDIKSLLDVYLYVMPSARRSGFMQEWESMITLVQLRLGLLDPTFAMGLARDRECMVRRDEVYGLMGASGVVIGTEMDSLEEVWPVWWERALSKGHVVWAMLPGHKDNCVMPALQSRCQALWDSAVRFSRPAEAIEIQNGTVSLTGRLAGACKLDTYLGPAERGKAKRLLDAALNKTSGDIEIIRRVYTAMSGGRYTRAELEAQAALRCTQYQWNGTGCTATQEVRMALETRFGKAKKITIALQVSGEAWLGTIENTEVKTDVLVCLNEGRRGMWKEKLLAIDVNARQGSEGSDAEKGIFMVALAPSDMELPTGSWIHPLHKIGITNSILVPEEQDIARAKAMNAHVFDTTQDRYYVGGSSCSFCHPITSRLSSDAIRPEGEQ
jgi:hypothetical protein